MLASLNRAQSLWKLYFKKFPPHTVRITIECVCLLAKAYYGYADQGTYLQIELKSVLVQNDNVGYVSLGTM